MDPNKMEKKTRDGLKNPPKIGPQNIHWARATKLKPNIQLKPKENRLENYSLNPCWDGRVPI